MAFLAIWICIVRYHQLRDWGVKTWQNQLILWSGLLCALGTSIVGNFQVRCAGSQPGVGGGGCQLPETGLQFPMFPAAFGRSFCRLDSQGFLGLVVLISLGPRGSLECFVK